MALLKEDGSLDIERINRLPYEEYMEEMGTLSKEQVDEYLSLLPINESTDPIQPVYVEYPLEDELKRGAVIIDDYIHNKMKELKKKMSRGTEQ